MQKGGNAAAKAFFQSHGMRDVGNPELKYQSRAAKLYMSHLKKLVAGVCVWTLRFCGGLVYLILYVIGHLN